MTYAGPELGLVMSAQAQVAMINIVALPFLFHVSPQLIVWGGAYKTSDYCRVIARVALIARYNR